MSNQVLSLLGLAQKAGKLASGEFAVEKAVKSGKAKLLLVAADASEATRKNYHDMATYYHVPIVEDLAKEVIGASIGKGQRAAIAVTDIGFCKSLLKLLASGQPKGE